MRNLFLFILFFTVSGNSFAQNTDSLIGKWFNTSMNASADTCQNNSKVYKKGKPTPKFYYLEFKEMGVCTITEQGKTPVNGAYSRKKNIITIFGTDYHLEIKDAKHLVLNRTGFSFTNEKGKLEHYDFYTLGFQKIK